MRANKYSLTIILRVAFLTLTLFLLANTFYRDAFFITQFFLLVIAVIQVFSLIKSVSKTRDEVIDFLQTLEFDDLSIRYKVSGDSSLDSLQREFNKIMNRLRSLREDKEDEFQYMKNIVQHVGIGLITFNGNGKVQMINTAAKRLLTINRLNNIDDLKDLSPRLVSIFYKLRTGGRELVRLEIGGDIVQLAVYAIQLTLKGEEFKLISIQNIQTELEEKEMEAWQNLVRVLTHEIMNSVTPITSLATTVETELSLKTRDDLEAVTLHKDDLEDILLAVRTIKKRGMGLSRFVQDFRNLTHIPTPKISEIPVKQLFEEIILLLKKELDDQEIKVSLIVDPIGMVIQADKGMIEQVLINLLKNAIQAFDEHKNRLIELKGYYGEKARPVLSVKDNGSGIEEEAVEKIFIPFFTTKKNGSGIGLSLSRQIMRQHKGVLGVKSKVDEGTEFVLKF